MVNRFSSLLDVSTWTSRRSWTDRWIDGRRTKRERETRFEEAKKASPSSFPSFEIPLSPRGLPGTIQTCNLYIAPCGPFLRKCTFFFFFFFLWAAKKEQLLFFSSASSSSFVRKHRSRKRRAHVNYTITVAARRVARHYSLTFLRVGHRVSCKPAPPFMICLGWCIEYRVERSSRLIDFFII